MVVLVNPNTSIIVHTSTNPWAHLGEVHCHGQPKVSSSTPRQQHQNMKPHYEKRYFQIELLLSEWSVEICKKYDFNSRLMKG